MEENFAHLLEANARRLGEKTALLWEGGSLTWSELDQRASGCAEQLAGESVGSGDRVAIVLPNSCDFVVAFLAVLKVGATAAPLGPDLKKEELDDLIADLRPKRIISEVERCAGFWETPREATSPAVIIYTSGSTGRPKGAVFSHAAVLFGNQTWGKVVMDLRPDDVVLGVLPYSHNYGLYAGLLAPLFLGAKVALVEHFSPDKLLECIEKLRVTVFPGVATMFSRLLTSATFSKTRVSTLRVTTSGAAPCSDALCKEWREATGVRILCGYGATEVPRTLSYLATDEDDMPGSAGKIVPGVEFRVVDEMDRPLPEGEVGELLIKSPSAMDGYLDHGAETREVLSEGWYRTGDLGTILPGNFVRLAGRKRERILRGGYSVFPQEIETVLLAHPAIAEAAVLGVPHTELGEEVAAFVALKMAAQASSEEIIAYTKDRLAHYKYPRHVMIVDELPRGLTGKTLKSELLKRWVAQ